MKILAVGWSHVFVGKVGTSIRRILVEIESAEVISIDWPRRQKTIEIEEVMLGGFLAGPFFL